MEMEYVITGASCLAVGFAGGAFSAHYFPNFRAWLGKKIAGTTT
jgi:hypothetical protein